MLYSYKFSTKFSNKFQELIDFIFYEIWMLAKTATSYELLSKNDFLSKIHKEHYYDNNTNYKNFLLLIDKIHEHFKDFDPSQISIIEQYYKLTNDIEKICADKSLAPLKYSNVTELLKLPNKNFENDILKFFDLCWESLRGLTDFKQLELGNEKFRENFWHENDKFLNCPMCGLNSIDGSVDIDHYLGKKMYAFVAVNEKNLAPLCLECNQRNKNAEDVLYNNNQRVKIFYPYANIASDIHIEVFDLKFIDGKVDSIKIKLISGQFSEEIIEWDRIYNIISRYENHLKNRIVNDLNMLLEQKTKKLTKENLVSPVDFVLEKADIENEINNDMGIYNDTRFLKTAFYKFWIKNIMHDYSKVKEYKDIMKTIKNI